MDPFIQPGPFTGWGPFADGLTDAARAVRLDRLAAATWAQGPDYAGLVEAVTLTKRHPRGVPHLPSRFNALPAAAQAAIKAAYGAG